MAGMRPAWQSNPTPRQPPTSSSALSSSQFPTPQASLLSHNGPHAGHHHHHGHGHHHHHHAVVQDKPTSAMDRILQMIEGFEDDMDCPLCLEEMDVSDLNFKPCPCGYQICRFCYHHIKENLNNRCPACRTPYDDATVEFKAIKPDELKRYEAAKKLRDKRRKEEALIAQARASVRVRQRNQVHVQGMTTKLANEDTINQLKGSDHFGQYGKVIKLFVTKRSPTTSLPASTHPLHQPVNVFVNYKTAAEASLCIAAIDGTTSPDGHKLKAIWGTTRYCPMYLKNIRCNNENCMLAHEQGEEIEGSGPVAGNDTYTIHASGDSDQPKRSSSAAAGSKKVEAATLPATASWASKNPQSNTLPTPPIILNPSLPPLSASIKPPPPPKVVVPKTPSQVLPPRPNARAKAEAKAKAAAAAAEEEKGKENIQARTTDAGEDQTSSSPIQETPGGATPIASSSAIPAVDDISSTGVTIEDLSNGASAVALGSSIERPRSGPGFPDFQFGDGAFSFSLDLDVKGKGRAFPDTVSPTSADMESHSSNDFFAPLDGIRSGSIDPASTSMASLYPSVSLTQQGPPTPSYLGSFDPFSDSPFSDDGPLHSNEPSPPGTGDIELASRRSSRFGFARRESQGLGSSFGRGSFSSGLSAGGRESPVASLGGLANGVGGGAGLAGGSTTFAPPGFGLNAGGQQHSHLQRSGSGAGFTSTGTEQQHNRISIDPSVLWPGITLSSSASSSSLPPGTLRSLASPQGSATSSPQLSPRTRASLPQQQQQQHHLQQQSQGPPPGMSISGAASGALPPGISLSRTPIPAASFPLPPPSAPRNASQSTGTVVGKDDLLALIAKAQASAPKPQQQLSDPHPFFSDPAILNARLASVSNTSSPAASSPLLAALQPQHHHQQQQQQPQMYPNANGMVGAAHYSLDGSGQPQQQQYRAFDQFSGFGGQGLAGGALPPPPGVRPPSSLQQQQQLLQQLYRKA